RTQKPGEPTPASSTNEPAPPPLPVAMPAKKKGAPAAKTPIAFETPPIALPDLHAVHDRFERAMRAIAERLADDAQVEVESISVHHVVTGSDKPQLTLGPAKLTVRRHEAQLDVAFTTQENASGTRLSLDANVPIEKGDARVAFSGGPITLAELGAKEGAGGLADVSSATVSANGSAVFKADASAITVDADVGVSHLGLSHPKLADDVVHGLEASMILRASYDDHGVLNIDDAEGTVGALHAQLRGSIVDARDHIEGALSFDAPTAACQSLLSSIPEALVPDVRDMELSGTFGVVGKLAFDTRDLDELELSYKIDDKCTFDHVSDDFDRERFTHPFQHMVYLPDGSTAEEESGPGSDAWVDLDRVSPYMQIAVLTTEDGAFFKHAGFNHAAIRASIIANLKA
ncbi:MAG: transglycosylase domain-containing protein, partial [Polyangiaceae bacterium]